MMDYKILLIDTRQDVLEEFKKIDWGEEFSVQIFPSGQEALAFLKEQPVHLIYVANQLFDMEGLRFLGFKNQIHNAEQIPVIMLSNEQDHKKRTLQMLEGVDDYFTIPFDPLELENRARILLREVYNISGLLKRSARGFSGNLSEMNLFDLLQTLELGRKTGIIHLQRLTEEALVFVREGLVYDAEANSRFGEEALFSLFTWTDGHFFVEFKAIDRERKILISSQELTLRGLKILEEWQTIRSEFPNLHMIPQLQQDIPEGQIQKEWRPVVLLIDGTKSLKKIMERSPLNEIETLAAIHQMQARGLVQESFPDLEQELLLVNSSRFNGEAKVDGEHLRRCIYAYMDGILGRRLPKERVKYLHAQHGAAAHSMERIQPEILFDKVELQYIKRKLLK